MKIDIFTDGAYSRKRDIGGIGIVFVKDNKIWYEYSKRIENTTNNKCELLAVIYALHSISNPFELITIYSDSKYVINCAVNGWTRKKNKGYWKLFDEELNKAKTFCNNIKFEWVKGHSDSEFNNKADKLATYACSD